MFLITCILIALIDGTWVYVHTDRGLLFFFLFSFCISCITLAFVSLSLPRFPSLCLLFPPFVFLFLGFWSISRSVLPFFSFSLPFHFPRFLLLSCTCCCILSLVIDWYCYCYCFIFVVCFSWWVRSCPIPNSAVCFAVVVDDGDDDDDDGDDDGDDDDDNDDDDDVGEEKDQERSTWESKKKWDRLSSCSLSQTTMLVAFSLSFCFFICIFFLRIPSLFSRPPLVLRDSSPARCHPGFVSSSLLCSFRLFLLLLFVIFVLFLFLALLGVIAFWIGFVPFLGYTRFNLQFESSCLFIISFRVLFWKWCHCEFRSCICR